MMNEIVLGKAINDEVRIDFSKMPHLLIASSPGHGMTTLINNLTRQLEVQGCSLIKINSQNEDEVLKMFIEIRQEQEKRIRLFAEYNVKNFDEYNLKVSKENSIRRLVILIEDLRELLDESWGYISNCSLIMYEISKILKISNSTGINIISAIQISDGKNIIRKIKHDITSVICSNIVDDISAMLLGSSDKIYVSDVSGRYLLIDRGRIVQFQTVEEKDKVLSKNELCNGISLAEDFSKVVNMNNNEIEEMAKWLKEQIPYKFTENIDLVIEECKLSSRSRVCYQAALRNISDKMYGASMHEIHDFIYGFGNDLESDMNDLEWMMLGQLVSLILDGFNNE
jgi:Ni2+-binding GTPase involved in maturation of urease and hydrogenase